MIRIRSVAAMSSIAILATAGMSVAQTDLTGYHYTYYADAAKTQYEGEVSDYGCGESAGMVYVVRAYVPTPYYDAEPIFTCSGGEIGPVG